MKRLKELRKEHEWSQKLLADQLNVAQNTVSQWERGEREPDFEMLSKIAELFEVSTDYLLGRTDDPIDWENYDGHIPEQFNGDAKRYHEFLENVEKDALNDPGLRPTDASANASQRRTAPVNFSEVEVAAFEGLTEDEREEMLKYAEFLISKRKK